MSIRSLLSIGLLAASAIASPPGYGCHTVTETETKEIIKHKTKTETDYLYKTQTKTKTVTDHATLTVTEQASCPAVSSSSVVTPPSSSVTTPPSSSITASPSSSSNTNPTTTIVATATATNYGLSDAAKAAGKTYFGTAADIPGTGEAQDPYYVAEFNNKHDFSGATPANIMKYEFTEPQPGVFNYTGAEQFLAAAEGKVIRCHNLIWASELPTWVTNPTTPWTNDTLSAALRRHVTNLIEYFGDRCYAWDVVNEAFSDNPAGTYASNIWHDTIGDAYVVEAFQAASDAVRAKNLKVKLYYNDYNIESPGAKATAAQNLVTELKSRNIQIDGIGLESHFIAGETPSQAAQEQNMNAFTALGVEVAVTELDVRLNLPATAATELQQKSDYYNTVAACVAVKGCVGVTLWDFVDTYSWVPSTFPGQGYADVWLQKDGANTPLTKKVAYDGVLEALQGKPE